MLENCKNKLQFQNLEISQISDLEYNQSIPDSFSINFNNLINDETHIFRTPLFQSSFVISDIPENKSIQEIFPKPQIDKKLEKNRKTYICKVCGKSYLSYPALYTHSKNKHNDKKIIIAKQRGRPKKGEIPVENKISYNPLSLEYFLKETRRGRVKKDDFPKCINGAFYLLKKFENYNNYENIESHNFFKEFSNDEHDCYRTIINEHEIIDRVFMNYLNRISLYCNNEYFIKLIAYIVLLRDFINNIKKIEEYTEENEVGDIPCLSNEFVNKFFSEDKAEIYFDFSFDEAAELMLNLCQWLYDNNYTCIKLAIKKKAQNSYNFL